MHIHYVYILKNKQDGRLYIGDRTAPNGNPYEDKAYLSSSKCMSKDYLNNCLKRVLKIFSTRREAKDFEIFLHNKYNVGVNPRFFNEAKQTSNKFCTSGKKFTFTDVHKANIGKAKLGNTNMLGKNHTQEAKDKIANSKVGKPRDRETKEKLRKINKELYQNGYINPMTGKSHTDSTKDKIRNKRMRPWYIKYPNGEIKNFYDVSTAQKALSEGRSRTYYSSLCNTSNGAPLKKGKHKYYSFGYIVDDIVSSI